MGPRPSGEPQAVEHLAVARLSRAAQGVDDVEVGRTWAGEGPGDEDAVVSLSRGGRQSSRRRGDCQRSEQEGHHDGRVG